MRKEIILPALAVVGGGVGFGLRRWELSTGFEPDTGLAIPGMTATYALVGLSILMVVALALLCRGKRPDFSGGYDQAFAAKGNTLYVTAMVCAALLSAAGGLLILMDVPAAFQLASVSADTGSPYLSVLPRVLLGGLAVASGWCLFTVGKNNYNGEGHGKYSSALLVPAYACCLWLITAYQVRSGDPVILDYAWELFAIMAAVLGTYFMAGFAFERAKVFRASFFALLTVYFSLVTLADGHELPYLLLYAAFVIYALASTVTLLFNCRQPQGPRMPRPHTDSTDETTNREGTPDEG